MNAQEIKAKVFDVLVEIEYQEAIIKQLVAYKTELLKELKGIEEAEKVEKQKKSEAES